MNKLPNTPSKSIEFSALSPHEIRQASVVNVTRRELYKIPERKPYEDGFLSPRLGVSLKGSDCLTCGKDMQNCPGHFGNMSLEKPCFHLGYFRLIVSIMSMICKNKYCCRILMSEDSIAKWHKKLKAAIDPIQRGIYLKKIALECKKVRKCPHCQSFNGVVKKSGGFSIIHEIYVNKPKLAGKKKEEQEKDSVDLSLMEKEAEISTPNTPNVNGDEELKGFIDDGDEAREWRSPDALSQTLRDEEALDLKEEAKERELHWSANLLLIEERADDYAYPLRMNEIKQHFNRIQHDISPEIAEQYLLNIKPVDRVLLGMKRGVRPENMLLREVPVPPATIRPSTPMEGSAATNEDDLTVQFTHVMHMNDTMAKATKRGGGTNTIEEQWEHLQVQLGYLFNFELPGISIHPPGRVMRSYSQRLKGKYGRFRGNLSGKRVDFTSRSVISPDPNLSINEVGVPRRVASTLTFPARVTPYNIEKLRAMVARGCDGDGLLPGANFLFKKVDSGISIPGCPPGYKKAYLKYPMCRNRADALEVGDIVERHLIDGDFVLFNRQPSLHRQSIMAHRCRIKKSNTFSLNICACAPYNADFDGDEMNVHFPQSVEAQAEASELMDLRKNLTTARDGSLIVSPTQDLISCVYLLTRQGFFADYNKAVKLLGYCGYLDNSCFLENSDNSNSSDSDNFGVGGNMLNLGLPSVLYPKRLWTGTDLLNALISKFWTNGSKGDIRREHVMEEVDRRKFKWKSTGSKVDVVLHEGLVMVGTIAKRDLNGRASFIRRLCSKNGDGEERAGGLIDAICKFTTRALDDFPLSFSMADVQPSADLRALKQEAVGSSFSAVDSIISSMANGTLPPQPGLTASEVKELMVNKELSGVRDTVGKYCLQAMDARSSALVMSLSGSKGSALNISQMSGCVGQQTVGGKRVPDGFPSRSLPCFAPGTDTPSSRGFVSSSFFSGLSATEFFFHTMAGREGLIDTAVKTAETGYMQRRLMKALEDVVYGYDKLVRGSDAMVVQATFKENDEENDEENDDGDGDDDDRLCPEEKRDERLELQAVKAGSYSRYPMYRTQKIEGDPVGAIAAQSIGERGTQMTLNAFHFAGIAAMNVTLGIPRIKEIVNAVKNIAIPVQHVAIDDDSLEKAKQVRLKLEKTTLRDLTCRVTEWTEAHQRRLEFTLSQKNLEALGLTMEEIQLRVAEREISFLKADGSRAKVGTQEGARAVGPKSKTLIGGSVSVEGEKLVIVLHDPAPFLIGKVTEDFLACHILGVPSINRAVVETQDRKSQVKAEGYGLQRVFGIEGVDYKRTRTIHATEAAAVLGIEAARQTIITEIHFTLNSHGIHIDPKHVELLADFMTYRGQVAGIARHDLVKTKDSALLLASFEKTVDHLFDAASTGYIDTLKGVSENVILGQNVPVGTGCFSMISVDGKVID